MALAYEGNTDLAFDTTTLRAYGERYSSIAEELRGMAKQLYKLLDDLASDGWTTPAGVEFQELAKTNWEENIDKYADLLDTLKDIIIEACTSYDNLTAQHIEKTKLK